MSDRPAAQPRSSFAESPDLAAARWSPAGSAGRRAFELLGEARSQTVGVLCDLSERAVNRLVASGKPLSAGDLFDDQELDEMGEALARLIALGDLMGRARVRLTADRDDERVAGQPLRTFAEWAGPFDGERGGKYWLPEGAPDRPENRRYDAPEPGTPAEGLAAAPDRTGIAGGRRSVIEAEAAQIPVTRRLISEYDEGEPPTGFWGQDDDGMPVMWFKTTAGAKYKIDFLPTDEPFPAGELLFSDQQGRIGATGSGGAAEVFTKVLAASVALLRAKRPNAVTFSAAGEGEEGDPRNTGRQRLYERLARGIANMDGEYAAVAFPGDTPADTFIYAVVKRDRLQKALDAARKQGRTGKVLVFADAPAHLWEAESHWPALDYRTFADVDGDGEDDLFRPITGYVPNVAPAQAIDYFRGLVPGLSKSPVRFGPALERYAFTLAVSSEQTILDRIKTAIMKELQDGTRATPDVQAILDAAGLSPRNPQYAEMVVRTNLNDAYNQGAEAELEVEDMRERFPVWQYLGIKDDRTGDDHRPKIGRYYPSSARFNEVRGPRVYNCVLPGQYVQGRVLRALKADYAGETVEIRTAQGRRLSLTVNHPVLTAAGFLAAGELKKGYHLVCHEARNQVAVLGEHDQHPPTKIEQVFEALAVRFGRARSAEVSALDLHGDAQFVVGQIEVVGADRELREQVYAARPEFRIEAALAGADVGAARVPGARPLLPNGERIDRAAARGLGLCDGGGTGGGRALGALGIGAGAHLDVPRGQPTQDGWATDPELTGKLVRGSAGAVLFDQIVHVERRQFAGHVYDLETEVGYYVVGAEPNQGTIVSNCRCSFRPVSRFLSDGLSVETDW